MGEKEILMDCDESKNNDVAVTFCLLYGCVCVRVLLAVFYLFLSQCSSKCVSAHLPDSLSVCLYLKICLTFGIL